jgi:histidine triad (HIT) family protein
LHHLEPSPEDAPRSAEQRFRVAVTEMQASSVLKRIAPGSPNSTATECIFCRIRDRSAPSEIVYEDPKYFAFLDAYPFSRGHTLVCPQEHGETIWDMEEADIAGLFQVASRISKAVVAAVGGDGFRFVQNNGEAARQVVAHVHVHIIPVKMEDREKFAGRTRISPEEMQVTAQAIRTKLGHS